MKEVTKKDLPEVSGGEYLPDGGCIPDPFKPSPWPGVDFPSLPTVPAPGDDDIISA